MGVLTHVAHKQIIVLGVRGKGRKERKERIVITTRTSRMSSSNRISKRAEKKSKLV